MSGTAPVAPAPPVPAGPPPSADRGAAGPLLRWAAPAAGALALVALLFWALAVGEDPAELPTGLASAGPLVEHGQPLVVLVGRIAAVGTVGTLVLAALLLPGAPGAQPAPARRALRAASGWALVWAVATALGALLTLSRLVGSPPAALPWASVRVFLEDTGAGRAAVLGVVLTGVVALGAARSTAAGARVLLVVAGGALVVPVVLSGHSAGADDHVLAVTTLAVHVVAAAVWVGGLGALLLHGRAALPEAAPRFSRLALGCFLATALTGVLAGWVVLGGTAALVAALGTGYGALLLAKTAALALLGLLGWQHRRTTLPRLAAGDGRGFRRFAVGEVALMLAAVTVAVALAASPPPAAAPAAPGTATAAPGAADPAPAAADPMAGHDHGELSVGVLVDEERFHVAGPVPAGSRVTVHNSSAEQVTLTAADGSFDLVLPPRALSTFLAPERPGGYPFTSEHSASFADVLVVR